MEEKLNIFDNLKSDFTVKNIFGVTTAGALYSTSGKIGGWTISSNSLVNGTFGTSGSAMMCTGTGTAKSIGGSTSISGWTFSSGANFGVTNTGALYCSDAHVSGEITATSGTIGGCHIDNGVLQIGIGGRNILRGSMAMPLVGGAGSWAKGSYVATSSTIGTSLTNIDITNSPVSGVTRGVRLTAVSG